MRFTNNRLTGLQTDKTWLGSSRVSCAGGGQSVWGEGVKWVVKGVGVRCVEGVDVHV